MNILITGGGSGIGAMLAKRFAERKEHILICGRDIEKLCDVSSSSENVIYYASCDVSKDKDVMKLLKIMRDEINEVDVLINAAAVQGSIGRFDTNLSDEWFETFRINCFGTYLMCKYMLPIVAKSETKKIINFSGGGAFDTFPNYSAYAVSKAGVVRLTENIAAEVKEFGITCNCIAPGFLPTLIHERTLKAGWKAGRQYNKVLESKDKDFSVQYRNVLECVEYLISPECTFTGRTISANFDEWRQKGFNEWINKNPDVFTMRRMNGRLNMSPDEEQRLWER